MDRCALVVPCFDEANRLNVSAFVDFLRQVPEGFHLVFVDDGSRDDTLAVLQRIGTEFPCSTVVLAKKPNAGKAEAVRFGMIYALEKLDPLVTGFWDADLATPLAAVPDLLRILEEMPEISMVFGARVQLLGREIVRNPARHYLGRIFATVVSNLLQLPVYDTQCGAKLFRASPDLHAVLHDPFLSRWIFDVEIIARFIRLRGVKSVHDAIYEFPLQRWEDIAGSKLRGSDFFRAAAEILEIYRRYIL